MDQLCNILWGLLGALTVAISTLVSWLLDNVPGLRDWWEARAAIVKMFLYAALTLAVGAGAWAVGRFALPCGWENDADIWYMILAAAASWFAGGMRHAKAKA
jgi:hypothetical protein